MVEQIWLLKNIPAFGNLTEESANSVFSHGEERTLEAGVVLEESLCSRDEVFFLISGSIEICCQHANGSRALLNILKAGDYWGWLESSAPDSEVLMLRTAEPVSYFVFSRAYFEEMMQRRPTVAISVTRMLGLRTRRYEFRLASILYQTSRQRLASLLLEISQASPEEPIFLSHEQLGSLVGLSREQVTRIVGEFTCAELIESHRRKIRVLDREGLKAIRLQAE